MRVIRVRPLTLFIDTKLCYINVNSSTEQSYPCIIGKHGYIAAAQGRESDGKTPLGEYQLRFGFFRADKLPPPKSSLTFMPVLRDDGWCDAPNDPAYNRFIRLPYPASHERLWRNDGAYDIILVMSHNDNPPKRDENGLGLGSAVFIHIAQPDMRPTLGCVAVSPDTMAALLPHLYTGMDVIIRESA